MRELGLRLPTAFKVEIDSTQTKPLGLIRKKLSEYDNQIVLIKDAHYSSPMVDYTLGIIKLIKENNTYYNFHPLHMKESRRLHYDDLEGLIVPSFKRSAGKIKCFVNP